jgi:hypothetical protein
MTLLILHIIASILALAGSLVLLVSTWVTDKTSGKTNLILASLLSLVSLSTGVVLLLQGSSIVRVCVEGSAVLSLNAGLLAYTRKVTTSRKEATSF